ncbi:MAG: hypothetical protein WCD42_07205 [Rhizomicrobium sp.]
MTLKRGWKTYACCAALIAVGIATAWGVHIPDWVPMILAGGAGAGGRLAIADNARTSATAIAVLIDSVKAATADSSAPSP